MLKRLRRICGAAAVLFICISMPAQAQNYPARPVRLVLPVPPGGGTDTLARIVGVPLGERLGQAVVIDNRAGAAGNLATEIAARATPDGYTLLMGFSSFLTVNPSLYKLTFDVEKDLTPIIHIANAQYVLVVHPAVPAKSVLELAALARQKPGQLNYASSGSGSPLHLAAELFKQRAGVNMVHVAYKGGGPAALAVLGGEVQVLFGSFAATMPYVKAGRLRALAVTGSKRSALMPDLPTVAESGFPGYEFSGWNGFFAPAKTPKPIIARINSEVMRILAQPEVRESFLKIGIEPSGSTPEQLSAIVHSESAQWAKVVKEAGIRPE